MAEEEIHEKERSRPAAVGEDVRCPMCGTVQKRLGPPKCYQCGTNIADLPRFEPERAARAAREARTFPLKGILVRSAIILAIGGAVIWYLLSRDPYQYRNEEYHFEMRAHGDWIIADTPMTGAVASIALLDKQRNTLRNQPAVHVFISRLKNPPATLLALSPDLIPSLQGRMRDAERLEVTPSQLGGREALRLLLRDRRREPRERWLVYVVLIDGQLYEFRAAARNEIFDQTLPDLERILSTVKFP